MLKSVPLLALKALASLPLELRRILGSSAGYMFSLLPSRERKLASLQLRMIFGHDRVLQSVFSAVGRSIMESLNLAPILRRSAALVSCSDPLLLERVGRQGGPAIVLSAHTGNWDLMAAYAVQHGWQLAVVGRPTRKALLHTILQRIRLSYGVQTLWRGELSAKRIVQALREGKVVGALIDQDTRVKSLNVPFMGVSAKTPASLAQIALRMRIPVLSAFVVRLPQDRFHIELQELSGFSSPQSLLEEFNRRLEQVIRRFPEQWVWFHKRWRSPNQDTTLSSTQYLDFLQSKLNEASA